LFRTEKSILIKTNNVFNVIITFHFVLFCWIFFRASDLNTAQQFLNEIIYNFSFVGLNDFYYNYKSVIFMILFGLILHFIPDNIGEWIVKKQMTFNMVYFVLCFLGFMVLYSFFKSAEPVMPIYLQF
jgi:hypothetical protein